jgi:hypothetical protein
MHAIEAILPGSADYGRCRIAACGNQGLNRRGSMTIHEGMNRRSWLKPSRVHHLRMTIECFGTADGMDTAELAQVTRSGLLRVFVAVVAG